MIVIRAILSMNTVAIFKCTGPIRVKHAVFSLQLVDCVHIEELIYCLFYIKCLNTIWKTNIIYLDLRERKFIRKNVCVNRSGCFIMIWQIKKFTALIWMEGAW